MILGGIFRINRVLSEGPAWRLACWRRVLRCWLAWRGGSSERPGEAANHRLQCLNRVMRAALYLVEGWRAGGGCL